MTIEHVITGYLLYFLIPLWVLVGFADWVCHRASDIEATTGVRESSIHLAMLAEGGIALLCGLFLEINALAIAILILLWLAHEITSFYDLTIATGERKITPTEQRVHDYLAVLPLTALSFVLVLHWRQAIALLGLGPEAADFSIRLKDSPLPLWYLVGVPLIVGVSNVGPYIEEFVRCVRASRQNVRSAAGNIS